MRDGSILVNISRGSVVDQDALVCHLRNTGSGIACAALDVTEPEPLPRDHPLLAMDNVILTPHAGSGTLPTRRAMMDKVIANLTAALEGKDTLPDQCTP